MSDDAMSIPEEIVIQGILLPHKNPVQLVELVFDKFHMKVSGSLVLTSGGELVIRMERKGEAQQVTLYGRLSTPVNVTTTWEE